jgi:Nif-specific regulatory protein
VPTEPTSRLAALVEISGQLMDPLAPEELLRRILCAAIELFRAGGCSIALVDEAEKQLAFTTVMGSIEAEEVRLELGQGIVGWVAERGLPVICNDVTQDPRFYPGVDRRTGFETRAILCAPLRLGDRLVGAIEVLNTDDPWGFTEADLELLRAFGGLAAVALDRARAVSRLKSANRALREEVDDRYELVAGRSPAMHEAVETARTAAAARTTVLLLGESGVGKEILARAVHRWSGRTGPSSR